MSLARKIGRIKATEGSNLTDRAVEASLRRTVEQTCQKYRLDVSFGQRLVTMLMAEAIRTQRKPHPTKPSQYQIFDEALRLERQGRRILHLELGEPDFLPPQAVRHELCRAVGAGESHYTAAAGLPVLREAIAHHVNDKYRLSLSPDNVLVTIGARFGVYLALATYLQPGSELIVPEPNWSAYALAATQIGARVVQLPTRLEDGWEVEPEELHELMSPATRMLALSNPNNPTGKILSPRRLAAITSLAADHKAIILADEVYSDYVFQPFASVLQMRQGEHIMVTSFSKSYAMTGYRVGYVVAGAETIRKLARLQSLLATSVAEFVQRAALVALRRRRDVWANARRIRHRLEQMGRLLGRHPIELYPAEGGFYLFPRVRKTGFDSTSFAWDLLQAKGVALAPGDTFGPYPNHFRLAVCAPVRQLRRAVEVIGARLR
jgi:aspartate aminotransferase